MQILGYNELKSGQSIYNGNNIKIDELLKGFPSHKLKNDTQNKEIIDEGEYFVDFGAFKNF